MPLKSLLAERSITARQFAEKAGILYTTVKDICSGRARLERCTAETAYKLTKELGVSMESLTEAAQRRTLRERSYEYGLPEYLQHDLDAYKEGLKTHSGLLDCLWGELYGSINIVQIDDGFITPEHTDYLRNKFLWGKGV